ncbi:MAG: hypothetical protein JW741_03055 [Sedimentisphaerales bacterium]|nr:hypothetical protein [Sedimentisphaerales bacterium]
MDAHYFVKLLKGVFCNITAIPAYFGLATLLLQLFPQWEGGKMKLVIHKIREHPALICMSFLMVSVILVSRGLYVNKPVPEPASLATPDTLIAPLLKDLSIRLADLTREDFVIRKKTFENCHIYGPAIILPKGTTTILRATFEKSPDISFLETSNKKVWGAVTLYDCTIIDCALHKISIMGSAEQIARWKAAWSQ